jgi:phosphoadenosine phosphosulfate reductase
MFAEVSLPPYDSDALQTQAAGLAARIGGLDGLDLLNAVLRVEFPGRIALVSSFGTESAVLLALAAEVDPAVPVLFLDTGRLFGETRRYRDQLVARLGLTGVRTLKPEPSEVKAADHDELLFQRNADACCHLRKVLPLDRALGGFAAWISGRKRYHGASRAALPVIEIDRAWIKINPLVNWSREQIQAEFERRALPAHPLEADGFLSIGCMPCSSRVAPGTDVRAGRWAGKEKTECGIHRPATAIPDLESVQTAA